MLLGSNSDGSAVIATGSPQLTVGSINATSTATSTFQGGISIASGCFAIGTTCVGGTGGGGSGTVSAGTIGQLPFYNSAGTTLTATSSIYLTQAGSIGIGTTAPSSLLDISGADSGTNIVLASNAMVAVTNRDATPKNFEDVSFLTTDANGVTQSSSKIVGVNTSHTANAISGDMTFMNRNAGTLAESMRLTAAGRVGIGTSTPRSLLEISGFLPAISLTDASTTRTASSTTWVMGNQGGNFYWATSSATTLATSSIAMTIASTTNVGIGTNLPLTKLHVVDGASFFKMSNTAGFEVHQPGGGNDWYYDSSQWEMAVSN